MKEYKLKKEIFKLISEHLSLAFESNDTEMVLAISELMEVVMQLDDSKEPLDINIPNPAVGAPMTQSISKPVSIGDFSEKEPLDTEGIVTDMYKQLGKSQSMVNNSLI